jgi:hypothetical protein
MKRPENEFKHKKRAEFKYKKAKKNDKTTQRTTQGDERINK